MNNEQKPKAIGMRKEVYLPALPDERKVDKKKCLLAGVFFGVALLLVLVLGGAFVLYRPGPLEKSTFFVVEKNKRPQDVGVDLQNQGIIKDPLIFISYARVAYKFGYQMRAGEYEIPARIGVHDLFAILQSGVVAQHKFTLPEGTTSIEAVKLLMTNAALEGKIDAVPREGTLLPETYYFTKGTTRTQIIVMMQLAQQGFLEKLWKEKIPNGKTVVLGDLYAPLSNVVTVEMPLPTLSRLAKKTALHNGGLTLTTGQLIVLASIIEKETSNPVEKSIVSSVFYNRLKKKMRLQADSTVIYDLSKGTGNLGRMPTHQDMKTRSNFNTYLYAGLPHSPITNPGKASLRAAFFPKETPYFFYVASAQHPGSHVFATTLAQQDKNIAAWIYGSRERK